ncbi:Septin-type guanine nucleotide-binding (G) domain-containing protein, partial [Scheffersomyces coipomensis]|uniref:Septin-type guanine nucleotide-binding (G) domain-containing protein n=1 Tax=Scheffersomyces coipomensis TaxID=1788519 RepID=UPI00315CF439
KKFTKRGLRLNILLVGENGTGKKTFINTLANRQYYDPAQRCESGNLFEFGSKAFNMRINTHTIMEQNATPISLNVSFTDNYGFNLENSTNSKDLIDFIENEYKAVLTEEIRIERNTLPYDSRIHVTLYFVKPTGKPLNEFDITNMKKLGERTNLIPIISKADTLTDSEVILNKNLIMGSIIDNQIEIFDFLSPFEHEHQIDEEDQEDYLYLKSLQELMPFTIIGSNSKFDSQDDKRFRVNTCGTIDVNDVSNCDFKILRNVLLASHIEEFKEATIIKKYENYRIEELVRMHHQKEEEENKPPMLKIYQQLREEEHQLQLQLEQQLQLQQLQLQQQQQQQQQFQQGGGGGAATLQEVETS